MQPLLDIRFKDGRQRLVDLQTYVSGDPFGQNVASEFEVRWDDISEGLILEISTNVPRAADKPKPGERPEEPDERGEVCELSSAAYYYILDIDDLARVTRVSYNGEVMLKSLEGELVVLAKLNELCADYLGDPAAVYLAIADLYPILKRRYQHLLDAEREPDFDIERAVALDMGITPNILAKALEFVDAMNEASQLAEGDDWGDDCEPEG